MAVVNYSRYHGQVEQAAIAALATTVIFLICYWLFGLSLVQQRLLARLAARRQASVV
jgi:ABC-type multidrug transport system permease subunit